MKYLLALVILAQANALTLSTRNDTEYYAAVKLLDDLYEVVQSEVTKAIPQVLKAVTTTKNNSKIIIQDGLNQINELAADLIAQVESLKEQYQDVENLESCTVYEDQINVLADNVTAEATLCGANTTSTAQSTIVKYATIINNYSIEVYNLYAELVQCLDVFDETNQNICVVTMTSQIMDDETYVDDIKSAVATATDLVTSWNKIYAQCYSSKIVQLVYQGDQIVQTITKCIQDLVSNSS